MESMQRTISIDTFKETKGDIHLIFFGFCWEMKVYLSLSLFEFEQLQSMHTDQNILQSRTGKLLKFNFFRTLIFSSLFV